MHSEIQVLLIKNKELSVTNKIKENLTVFFGVIFIMSMVGAAGAIEADEYLTGAMLTITGLLTGTLTAVLQK